ncbi:MFS transporter [Streptomyces sp. NPDC006704]|uniref:MFS transporter n=1 Tax=Streptomyces sp. NPDC006704 TaxID=3364760 RepID=UPI0036849522
MSGPSRLRQLPLPLKALFVATFVNRAGMFVFPLLTVYLVRGKGLDPGAAGLLISVAGTGLLAGSLLSGPVCERGGRRAALLTALVLNAAGNLGLAVLDGPPWTYATPLFVALTGMGMFGPASNTLVAALTTREQRPFAYTVGYIATNLGMGVGPLLGGLAAAYSYRVMFAGDILASLLCAELIRRWIPHDGRTSVATTANSRTRRGVSAVTPQRDRPRRDRHPRHDRHHRHVRLLVLLSFFYVVPLIGLEYALPLTVTTVLHGSAGLVGVVYTINSVVVVGLGLPIEKRLRGHGVKRPLLVAGLLWTLGLCVIVLGFSLPALLLSTVVWTLGEIIASVVVPTYVADQVEERRVGRLMALGGFVLGLARLAVPAGLGALWTAEGHRAVFLVLLCAPLVGMAGFALVRTRPVAPQGVRAPGDRGGRTDGSSVEAAGGASPGGGGREVGRVGGEAG